MSQLLLNIVTKLPIAKFIEGYYPFSADELKFLARQKSDFTLISQNEQIAWNPELISHLQNVLDWDSLSMLENIPWDNMVLSFLDKINWENVCYNNAFPWRDEYLEKYADKIDWDLLSDKKFPFTKENLFRFQEKWQWGRLSVNENITWSEEVLDHFSQQWDWKGLSYNSGITFSPLLLEKYRNRWDFDLMYLNPQLICNESLPLLQNYAPINYEFISANKEDFSLDFLEKYKDQLYWNELSANEFLPWSEELLKRYSNRWSYLEMSGNTKIPWSSELLEAQINEWNWDGKKCNEKGMNLCLSDNQGLSWSFELVEKYKNLWEWGHCKYVPKENYFLAYDGITRIKKLTWTVDKMAKYAHYFDSEYILGNRNFYLAIENEVGRSNVFNLYRSLI
jgi:hypothetical protein